MRPSLSEPLGLQTIIIRKSCQDIFGTYGYGSGVQVKKNRLGRCPSDGRRVEVLLADPSARMNVLKIATYEKVESIIEEEAKPSNSSTANLKRRPEELSREEMGPENPMGKRLLHSLARMSPSSPLVLTVDPDKKIILEFSSAVSAKPQRPLRRR